MPDNIKTLIEERNDGIREGVYVDWDTCDEDYSDEDHAI